ncbi:hypothetical protein [Lyngbya sp. CCY1209]|nr:hypothetical protein [Lyngbya sp. CCY1209]MEB3885407.1 hypothetical protein [Lyngbya sp. CCY1209]
MIGTKSNSFRRRSRAQKAQILVGFSERMPTLFFVNLNGLGLQMSTVLS